MKRLFAIVLCLVLCMSLVAVTASAAGGTKVYLKPNENWLQGNARFAIYFFGNGDGWADLTDSNGDGIYEGEVPAGYTKVIFCRMNPDAAENNWNNKWNQSQDLDVPTDNTNCFYVADGSWDKQGSWGTKDGDIPEVEIVAPEITVMCIKGSGIDGVNWNDNDTANAMTETSKGVYELTFKNVQPGEVQIKFAANGSWAHNFGGTFVASGEETAADYNGGNIVVNLTEASDLSIKLDLTNWVYDAQQNAGAKFTVTIAAVSGEVTPPVEEEPEVPAEPETVIVKAKAPEGWTKVMLYAWNSTGNVAAWPGSEMTLGEDGWYVAEVPAWVDHVIINNGEGAQTIDLAVEAGKNVLVVVGEQGADGKFDGTVSYEAAKTGDASPIFAVVAVMLVAGAALVTTASKKKFF